MGEGEGGVNSGGGADALIRVRDSSCLSCYSTLFQGCGSLFGRNVIPFQAQDAT